MSVLRILHRAAAPAAAALVAAAVLASVPAAAFCQQSGGTPPASSEGNAFPQAQSEAATKAARRKQTVPPSNTHEANGVQSGKSSTAQGNPFPEAQSKAAAKAESGGAQSSSSPRGYSSSDAGLPPSALGEEKLGSESHRKLDSYARDKTQDGRIADDLKVASFYMTNANYRGALWRYQDALQYDPLNDTALYGVAEALCKQNRTMEARAHFESYAKNNPQGRYALKAEKMLAHPGKCKHNW